PQTTADGPVPSWIVQGNTLEERANKVDIDPAGLADQVATFNQSARTGVDEQYARGSDEYDRYWGDPQHEPNPVLGELTQGPFYAVELHLGSAGNRGGLVIDGSGRVRSVTGEVIPGLYACGHTMADLVFGGGYNSGTAIGSAMAFGYRTAVDVTSDVTVAR
nr:FAD-binding protein [Micromonospora sp. DSM 115978]